MGNVMTTPIHKDIPESIPIDRSEIKENAKEIWYKMQRRARTVDVATDPWFSRYSELVLAEKIPLRQKISAYLPGLGTAAGIFAIYCALEQLGLYDDGGWKAWTTHREEEH